MATDSQVLRQILSLTQLLNRKADILMTQQDDLNAEATQIEADVARISAATQVIKTELAALEAQVAAGQPVDLSSLQSAVADLDAATAGAESNEPPAPPAP